MEYDFQTIVCSIGLIIIAFYFAYATQTGIDKNDLKKSEK